MNLSSPLTVLYNRKTAFETKERLYTIGKVSESNDRETFE